ncbi:cation:proton antiporter [Devosia sp.]|uniref:cation:proton antiporter n=1 Tax=Devosia sp. TaxID=1871048 RepID=UPI00326782E7
MSGTELLAWASLAGLMLLGAAMLLCSIRILIGPTLPDRVLALDLMTTLALAFVAVFAVRSGVAFYLDIAIALGLLGFLSTLAFVRYILSKSTEEAKP